MWGITEETWQVRPQVFLQAKLEAPEATAAPGAKKPENHMKRKTRMQLHAYTEYSLAKEKAWFKKLLDPRQTDEVPKPEQERFLRCIAARCRYEYDRAYALQSPTQAILSSLQLEQGTPMLCSDVATGVSEAWLVPCLLKLLALGSRASL